MTPPSILLLSDRSGWPERVRGWTDRFDVTTCRSGEEVRAHIASSRPWAAFLLDGLHPAADRDLLALAAKSGSPTMVVADAATVDWLSLGAITVLGSDFAADELAAAISMQPVRQGPESQLAPVVAVMGPGGTGASTIAIAIAQGLAQNRPDVLLADFARHAEQHVLHDLRSDRPGVGDLVEAHRTAAPDAGTLRQLAETVEARGYHVLGGLRRAVGWSSLRPRAVEATLNGLRNAFDVVVCDIDADLEGEAESGSFDIEERNILGRSAVAASCAVVVVGGPGVKGTHSILRVLGEIWAHGVSPRRTVVVVNRGDEVALQRLGDALNRLAGEGRTLLYVPQTAVDETLLKSLPMPASVVDPVTQAVEPLLAAPIDGSSAGAVRILPGSLGSAPG